MKQKILDALKARFTGVSDAVLGRIADKLAKTATTDEQVQPAVDGVTFQQIIDGEADRRATEATQSAVTNYEKKHGLKDGQKVQAGGGTEENNPDKNKGGGTEENGEVPAWAKALIDSNRNLAEKITGLEKEKLSGSRKQKLDAVIGKLPETLRKPYARISLTDMTDQEFETFLTETTADAEGVVTDLAAKGSVLKPPGGVSQTKQGKEATKEELDAVKEKLQI